MFTVGGLVTGLDTQSIIDAMVKVERVPIDRLQTREVGFQDKISSLQALNTLLKTLQDEAQTLKDTTDPLLGRVATSQNEGVATVTASDDASIGSFSLEVTALAKAQSLATAAGRFADADSATVGTGTLTLSVGAGSPVDLTIDSSNNTLDGIRDAINAADIGVTASIVNDGGASPYRLVITSNSSGVSNSVTLSVSDDGDGNDADDAGLSQLINASLDEVQAPSDAQIVVNGISVSSPTNTVTDAIPGATLEIKATTSGSPVEITVTESTSKLEKALRSFVDSFNEIKKYDVLQNNLDSPGPLAGDFTLRSVSSRLASFVLGFGAYGNNDIRALSDIGVRMGKGGQLEFDASTFQDALQHDRASVESFLRGDGAEDNGFFGNLFDAIDGFVDPVSGAIHGRTEGLNANIKRINSQVSLAEIRISAFEERITKQFSNLELMVNNLQTQGTSLLQALSNLPPVSTGQGG
jgi:flagellar hook-associated protein 2